MEAICAKDPDTPYRILIVDPHPLVRLGLATLIDQEVDMAVCGQAKGMSEALLPSNGPRPALVVTALSLCDGHGLELIRRLHAKDHHLPIVVWSDHDEGLYADRAIKAGARGYVNKSEAARTLIAAIRHVLAGGIWLSATSREQTFMKLIAIAALPEANLLDRLTDRELMVFDLTGHGIALGQIADGLHMSLKTAETHRDSIRRKLSLDSSGAFTRVALSWMLYESGYRPEDRGRAMQVIFLSLVGAPSPAVPFASQRP